MNIHEYQAKAVLKEFGVPVSRGVPILNGKPYISRLFNQDEAEEEESSPYDVK